MRVGKPGITATERSRTMALYLLVVITLTISIVSLCFIVKISKVQLHFLELFCFAHDGGACDWVRKVLKLHLDDIHRRLEQIERERGV